MTDRTLSEKEQREVISLLQKWLVRCRVAISAYNDATVRANAIDWRLGVPATAISTVLGAGAFATIRSGLSQRWQLIAGLLAITAALLTAMRTFMHSVERAEQYREAARSYGRLRRDIERAVALPPTTFEAAEQLLDRIANELAEAGRGKPNVARRIWNKAEYKVKGTTDARGAAAVLLKVGERMGVRAGVRPLPENHARYFRDVDEALEVPLEELHPSVPEEQQPASVRRAEERMREAADEQRPKRSPITARRLDDHDYIIEDGNATWAVAKKSGWRSLPIIISNRPK